MKTTLEQMRLSNPNHPEQEEIDNEYLDTVFEDFFSIVWNQLSMYTVSIKEYAYMCLFLYPHYMEKVYLLNGEIKRIQI
jgi:hypothetical protein